MCCGVVCGIETQAAHVMRGVFASVSDPSEKNSSILNNLKMGLFSLSARIISVIGVQLC